jgi:hypothetical protein
VRTSIVFQFCEHFSGKSMPSPPHYGYRECFSIRSFPASSDEIISRLTSQVKIGGKLLLFYGRKIYLVLKNIASAGEQPRLHMSRILSLYGIFYVSLSYNLIKREISYAFVCSICLCSAFLNVAICLFRGVRVIFFRLNDTKDSENIFSVLQNQNY